MIKDAMDICLCRPVLRRSIVVAILVGTIINLINQGDTLFTGGDVQWLKVGLTYMVPFFVASYGAYIGSKTTR